MVRWGRRLLRQPEKVRRERKKKKKEITQRRRGRQGIAEKRGIISEKEK
jgi:hypothetical protein